MRYSFSGEPHRLSHGGLNAHVKAASAALISPPCVYCFEDTLQPLTSPLTCRERPSLLCFAARCRVTPNNYEVAKGPDL